MNIRDVAKSCGEGEFLFKKENSIEKQPLNKAGITVKTIIKTTGPMHVNTWVINEIGENYFNAIEINSLENQTVFKNSKTPGFMEGHAHKFKHAKYMAPSYDIIEIIGEASDEVFQKIIENHKADCALNLYLMKQRNG